MNNSSSSSRFSKQKLKLKKAFQSAKSVDKQLKLFKQMEKVFDESELFFECWALSLERCQSPEHVISFGTRALRTLISNDNTNTPCLGSPSSGFALIFGSDGVPCYRHHKLSLYIAQLCTLLAKASLKLKRYNESLSYLNWAVRNLSKLEKDDDNSCDSNCCLQLSLMIHFELYLLKLEMGRIEETVTPYRKVLEIQESLLEGGCIELGHLNRGLGDTYLINMNYKEALPFCLKSLEIFTKHLEPTSGEVAEMMRILAVIYIELGEYDKALEQNQLLRNMVQPDSPESLDFESDHGDILIGLGKYEEAIDVLRRVVSHTYTKRETRASASFTMARAFCCLEKFDDAEKYMKKALNYTKKMEEGINVAVRFRNMSSMSRLYEKKNDYENAIFLLGRALIISDLPRKILAEGAARFFSLISLSGQKEEGIPYMEDVVEKLKQKFGEEDCEVAHGYRNLGAIYLKSGQEKLAVKFMLKAKNIMDVALGPHHLESLKTSHALAETYATMRRHDPAIEIQEKVVKGLEVLEPREQEFLDKAVELLNKVKERVTESPTKSEPQSNDDRDLLAEISKCGISDDTLVIVRD